MTRSRNRPTRRTIGPLEKPRLVVPGDGKGGRYVGGLTELRVVDLGVN